jgi:hydrogenase maturation protease
MEKNLEKILVLGIGNEILKDDGIGPRLIKDLKKEHYSLPICFQNSSLGGLEILEMVRDYNTVIIIDAIKTVNGTPGDVYYFNPEDFHETMHLSNLHDVNFITAIELAKKIKLSIPETIHIIAVEIMEDMEFGHQLSPELEKRYPEIFEEVHDQLVSLLMMVEE